MQNPFCVTVADVGTWKQVRMQGAAFHANRNHGEKTHNDARKRILALCYKAHPHDLSRKECVVLLGHTILHPMLGLHLMGFDSNRSQQNSGKNHTSGLVIPR